MGDPFPASQLAYAASTQECGYPVDLPKKKKCEDCSKLPCLIEARMKCYAWKCKSRTSATSAWRTSCPRPSSSDAARQPSVAQLASAQRHACAFARMRAMASEGGGLLVETTG